jgi:hypothetical protein
MKGSQSIYSANQWHTRNGNEAEIFVKSRYGRNVFWVMVAVALCGDEAAISREN